MSSKPQGATHTGDRNEQYYKYSIADSCWVVFKESEWRKSKEVNDTNAVILLSVIGSVAGNTHPKQDRYRQSDGTTDDFLDKFFATHTPEEVRGAMKFTIGKYQDRLGKKDSEVKEVTKIADYSNRWMEYERGLEEQS